MRMFCSSPSSPLKPAVVPAFLAFMMALAAALAGCGGGKEPAKPGVVATYADGEITADDLRKSLDDRIKDLKMMVGDQAAQIDEQIPRDMELYRGLIQEMVLDELVKRKIREKQLDNRGNIRHALEHVEEQMTLQQFHGEIHEKNKIPMTEVEIQDYYDRNRDRFGEKPLYEVREEIKADLEVQKEAGYMETYLKELKEVANVTRDYEVLRVPDPGGEEMREYYEKNRESYREPEKWVIDQVEFTGAKAGAEEWTEAKAGPEVEPDGKVGTDPEAEGMAGADGSGGARARAEKVWARLGAGEDFEAVTEPYKRDGAFKTVNYTTGSRGDAFEKAVASLSPGEYSKPVEEDGKYFLVRLKEKVPASYASFQAVKDEVRRAVKEEREAKVYEENTNKTLFTLHGRRFTLGDFYREFKEMRPAEREKYASFEGRCRLVDRMIDRLLLLEDSYDRMLQAKNKEAVEHIREDVLKEELHREEVDQKIEVSDGEVEKYYGEHREQFKTPDRAMVNIILVRGGEGEAEGKRAQAKIQEAYGKLSPGLFRTGMAFEEVAKQYSEDPQSAQDGGKLNMWIGESGNVLDEMFNHELHEQVMHLDQGEISKPFRIGEDYLIVQVREKDKPRQEAFEAVKADLKRALEARKHRELTAKMYTDLIRSANLSINEKALASMVDKEQRKQKEQNDQNEQKARKEPKELKEAKKSQ